jgi:NADH-quinone oxidoreductase subunit J
MTAAMQAWVIATAGLGGLGVYLLMPRGAAPGRNAGIALAVLGLLSLWVIWWQNFRDVGFAARLVFYIVATWTVTSAVMMVTQRNPVSSALWFASVVIGTASLFLMQNAQFLAVASVIVYAGAIVVMFLFVVMMTQQTGTARHDRYSREPFLGVAASFNLIVALASVSIATYGGSSPTLAPVAGGAPVFDTAFMPDTSAVIAAGRDHVASLGAALFTEHWLSLELAGTLLLVAMVGAIVIAARRT